MPFGAINGKQDPARQVVLSGVHRLAPPSQGSGRGRTTESETLPIRGSSDTAPSPAAHRYQPGPYLLGQPDDPQGLSFFSIRCPSVTVRPAERTFSTSAASTSRASLLGDPLAFFDLRLELYTLEVGGFVIDRRSYGVDPKGVNHVQLSVGFLGEIRALGRPTRPPLIRRLLEGSWWERSH